MTDYYKLLGVMPTATTEEIKKSYRQLALKYHPDRNAGDKKSEDYFKKVTEAYSILSDPEQRESYNWEYRKSQESSAHQKQQQRHESRQKPKITPQIVLTIFQDVRKKVFSIDKSKINQSALYNTLNDLLADNNVNFLISSGDTNINELIVKEVMACFKVMKYQYVKYLSVNLAKLAGSNNDSIKEIFTFVKNEKKRQFRENYGVIIVLAFAVTLFAMVAWLSAKESYPSKMNSHSNGTPDGDLNSTFVENKPTSLSNKPETKETQSNYVPKLTPEEIFQKEKEKLIAEGWEETEIKNGQLPSCYNFIPRKSEINNYLEVHVGGGTDVAIKVMNIRTQKCIRYVFINSGSIYKIRNIPEGIYYLKIAYGKDWFSKVENGQCVGKFFRNPIYEKGDDIMDFNLQHTSDGYSIPSFELKLDVIATNTMNTFSSEDISENEFNK